MLGRVQGVLFVIFASFTDTVRTQLYSQSLSANFCAHMDLVY